MDCVRDHTACRHSKLLCMYIKTNKNVCLHVFACIYCTCRDMLYCTKYLWICCDLSNDGLFWFVKTDCDFPVYPLLAA